MCPKGRDPLKLYSTFRTIKMTTTATSGTMAGYLAVAFQGQMTAFPANGNSFSSAKCKAALEALPNIGQVTCTQGYTLGRGSTSYVIEFLTFPSIPYQNNIFYHEGSPTVNSFACGTEGVSGAVGVTCTISDVVLVPTGIPGEVYCLLGCLARTAIPYLD